MRPQRSTSSFSDELLIVAHRITDESSHRAVEEFAVKGALAAFGVAVPHGAIGRDLSELEESLHELRSPLVLKAYGDGLLHKSDVGAVMVGLTAHDIPDALDAMRARLRAHGIQPDGFLVEEQAPPGVELLVGVTRRDPFGDVVVLGIGGTLVEAIDRSWTRIAPLTNETAASLVDELPSVILDGARSLVPVDRDALVKLLLAIAGPDGFCEQLGSHLVEFECNPVIVGEHGPVAVDARLVLDEAPDARQGDRGSCDFGSLFAPATVAVAGASSTRSTFGNWFLQAYRSVGWTDGLYALHPDADSIDGVPAIRSASDVAGGIDYLLAAVPAARVPALVAENGPSTRFVHVISGGFAEVGPTGAILEQELVDAARSTGARVLGPNCMGAFSPTGRQTFMMNAPRDAGRTSVISQSGSLASDIVRGGDARGVRFARFVTVGNCADVGIGELLGWLLDDDTTGPIGLYVEGPRDRQLIEEIRRGAGRKPIVALAGGTSSQGSVAAASHTGAMTGDSRLWDAVAATYGVTVTRTLDHFLAALAYLEHHENTTVEGEHGVLIVGPGGGASVLATDAFDRAGVRVAPVRDDVVRQLVDAGYGAGTSVRNPVEIPIGPATPPDSFDRLLSPLLRAQPFQDVVLQLSLASFYNFPGAGIDGLVATLGSIGERNYPGTRVALVLRSLDCAPIDDLGRVRAAARAANVVVFRDFDECAAAVAAAQRFDRFRQLPSKSDHRSNDPRGVA